MAPPLISIAVPLLLCASFCLLSATAQEGATSTEWQQEVEKLKGWKTYLLAEVDKYKAEAERVQAVLATEQQRSSDLSVQVDQLKKDAEAALAKATEAEALASSHAAYSSQLSVQLEQVKQEAAAKAAEAESRASAHSAAADASNSEAALLRRQLAEAVAERQALDERIAELASATAKAGGLRGHARAIYDILLDEVDRHRETALNYANDKLPGFKAKVSEVHATVSSKIPNVTGHVGQFVSNVDGELRPWLRQTLGSVPSLKRYSEDPVVLQGIVVFILGAPVLLLLLPLLSCFFRLISRRPRTSSDRAFEAKSARRGKKKQG